MQTVCHFILEHGCKIFNIEVVKQLSIKRLRMYKIEYKMLSSCVPSENTQRSKGLGELDVTLDDTFISDGRQVEKDCQVICDVYISRIRDM